MLLSGYGRWVANRAHPLNSGRVAWYLGLPGMLNPGERWLDLMGRADMVSVVTNNGTPPAPGDGPSWNTTSVRFSASSFGRFLAKSFPYPTGSAFSMSAWFRLNPNASGVSPICGNWTSGAQGPLLEPTSGNAPRGYLATSNSNYSTSSGTNIATGKWFLSTMTYDGATLRIYANGVSMNSTSATGTVVAGASNNFYLGYNDGGEFAYGEVADVAVWSRCLAAAEVSQLFTAPQSGYAGMIVPPMQIPWSDAGAPAVALDWLPWDRACDLDAHRRRRSVAAGVARRSLFALADVPRAEAVQLDKFHPVMEGVEPHVRHRRRRVQSLVPNSWQIHQPLTFEAVQLDKFSPEMAPPPDRVAQRRRQLVLPAGAMGMPALADAQDPVLTLGNLPWNNPLSLPPWRQGVGRSRQWRHLMTWLAEVLTDEFAQEDPANKFDVRMSDVPHLARLRARRPWGHEQGRMDMDAGDRAERVSLEHLAMQNLPAGRRALTAALVDFWKGMNDPSLFAAAMIPRLRSWMLSGGFRRMRY